MEIKIEGLKTNVEESVKSVKNDLEKIDKSKVYDIAIIGGGTAALGAALYAARYNLKPILIAENIGGAILDAVSVENYLGIEKISGVELVNRFRNHVNKYKVPILESRVVEKIEKKKESNKEYNGRDDKTVFYIYTDADEVFKAFTVIIATGTHRRRLGLPKEKELTGKGISYCTTCDAAFFRDKVVGVVGGGDSAVIGAIELGNIAKKVFMFVRSKIRAEPINQESLKPFIDSGKVEIIMPVTVKELVGEDHLEGVILSNGDKILLDGLFIEIGGIPNTSFLSVEKDEMGHIVVNKFMETNEAGIFAAGDVTNNPLKQCITAAAEGAIAATSAYKYLKKNKLLI